MIARRVLKRMAVLGALAFALVGAAGCDVEDVFGPRVESTIVGTTSFAVVGAPTIDAVTANGAVHLRTAAGQTDVRVQMTLRSRGTTLEEATARVEKIVVRAEQEGDRIVLRYVASEQDAEVRRRSGVDFDVTLPQSADVHAETSNGAIRVVGIRGALDLTTSNGEIAVSDFAGDVSARTLNGQIVVDGGEGALHLETSNGRIRIAHVAAVVDAETSNGEITFSGRLLDGAHRLVTSNGHIGVRVPNTAAIRVVAQTNNASISSSLPLVGDTAGRSWDAVQNAPAAATLTMETSNGAIDLEALPQEE